MGGIDTFVYNGLKTQNIVHSHAFSPWPKSSSLLLFFIFLLGFKVCREAELVLRMSSAPANADDLRLID